MSKPRLCTYCGDPVGRHSHEYPHPCKADRCGCPAYGRKPVDSGPEKDRLGVYTNP